MREVVVHEDCVFHSRSVQETLSHSGIAIILDTDLTGKLTSLVVAAEPRVFEVGISMPGGGRWMANVFKKSPLPPLAPARACCVREQRMISMDGQVVEPTFDLPPHFPLFERRRAGMAEQEWRRAGRTLATGFGNHSVTVDDPGGAARLRQVGQAVSETFGLYADMALTRDDAIGAELTAACDLIALRPEPLHFEASLMAPHLACILLRGVALPIEDDTAVQIVLSWREILNRTATARLRRDLTMALRYSPQISTGFDPFSPDFVSNS